ncbi:glycosyltransferase family 4 protein [Pseudobdellovibrio sp. HCB154]|uniref:glycosyltransferase family 4 protein n=1 Tax=Pseudobdellovibrio sp. HCB154 TaxID=3386277 RepID=UPI003916FF00
MKISIFSYVFWPEYFLVNELAEALVQKGHQVAVQTSLPNYQSGSLAKNYSYLTGPYFEKNNGVNIYRYPVIPRKRSFVFLALNYMSNVIIGFLNLFRLPKSDVYFFFATSPLLFILPVVILKKITKKPLVIWYQDLWPDSFFAITNLNPQGILLKLLNPFINFIYKNTDLMLLQSPTFEENLKRYNYQGSIEVLYNWAPSFKPVTSVPAWLAELPKDKFILTFAGNLGQAQALDHLIEAAKHLQDEVPQLHIALVGEGSFAANLKKRAQELALSNVCFYGRKPVDEMPALFAQSDALLVSLKDDPTFNAVVPSKIQAYMTSGKPIVAFLNGAGAQVVARAACGVVVPAEDAKALVEKIKLLVAKTPIERAEMGANGQSFFKANFEMTKSVVKIENYLRELTEKV